MPCLSARSVTVLRRPDAGIESKSKLTARRRFGDTLRNVARCDRPSSSMRWNSDAFKPARSMPGRNSYGLADPGGGLPAGQCLDGDDIACAHVDDRLEVGADLATVEGVHELRRRLVERRRRDADRRPGGGDRCLGGVEGCSEPDAGQTSTDTDPRSDAGGAEGLTQMGFECHCLGGAEVDGEDAELEAGDPGAEVAALRWSSSRSLPKSASNSSPASWPERLLRSCSSSRQIMKIQACSPLALQRSSSRLSCVSHAWRVAVAVSASSERSPARVGGCSQRVHPRLRRANRACWPAVGPAIRRVPASGRDARG